ncbi:MAG: hypothetical protein P4M01_13095 [Acidobacteriota bacterium]|nr:hypothetical protein [Acidobacteriota bacterium]
MSDTPEAPVPAAPPLRRDEEIALEMMKFIANTAGYGRAGTAAAGFQGNSANNPEELSRQLLELYGQCLQKVRDGQ